jgi:hypothetical protein
MFHHCPLLVARYSEPTHAFALLWKGRPHFVMPLDIHTDL